MVVAPKVSVIIPCYNLGEFLDEAVVSVLAQTCQDFEILDRRRRIDRCGNPGAARRTIAAEDARHPSSTQRPRLPGTLAIAQATGPYLCALDADDRLEPIIFRKGGVDSRQRPVLTFVSCWLRTFGDEEWEWKPERCDLPTVLWEDTVLTASLVRRQAVEAVGGYDTRMPIQGLEDWDLWLMLAERGYRGVILREVLFNYRRRPVAEHRFLERVGHLPLMEYRVAKHGGTYRKHLVDVLLHQDTETAAMLRRNDASSGISRPNWSRLPRRDRRERWTRLASLTLRPDASTHARARGGPDRGGGGSPALRTSMSWRLTAPLRRVYGRWWLRARSAP